MINPKRIRTTVPFRILLLFAVLFFSVTEMNAQDENNLTFTFQQGGFLRCLRDTTSTIQITPNPSLTPTRILLVWIDGVTAPIEILPPFGTNLTQSFTYPARDLLDICDYQEGCIPDIGRCYGTQVVAFYEELGDNGNPINENLTRTVTFRKPPELSITGANGPYCVGQTVNLSTRLCPSNDPSNGPITWTLPDGTETETEPEFTFTETGTFTFSARTTNGCGDDMTSVSIEVIAEPVAIAFPDSGLLNNPDAFQVCLADTAFVRLNSSNSTGLTARDWLVSGPSGGAFIFNEGQPFSTVRFTRPGIYTFTFRGENDNCDLVDEEEPFTIEVRTGTVPIINPQTDVCETLEYSPSPLSADLDYTVNGTSYVSTDFPVVLGPGQYTVSAEANTVDEFCGPQPPARDTFAILEPVVAMIEGPDTIIRCDQEPAFDLAVDVTGGQWRRNGTVFNGTIDPGSLTSGTYTITYGDPPCVVEDGITLIILGTDIETESDQFLCIDQEEVTFTSTPGNGTYSEAGGNVSPDGRFDPGAAGIGEYVILYSIDVEGSDVPCGSVDSFRVTVSELEASFDVVDCAGDTVCFALPEGFVFDSAEWDFGGAGSATGGSPCFEFPDSGTYSVSVTVTRGPCEDTFTQPVVIEPAPEPQFALIYNQDSCSVLDVTITNNSLTGDNLRYDWRLNGTSFSTMPNPGPLQLTATGVDSVYVIELRLANDCTERSFSESITVLPQPVARLETNRDQYCSGDTIRISNTSFGAPENYEWTQDGIVIGNDSFPPVIFYETSSLDTVEICLTVSGKCGENVRCKEVRVLPTDVTAFFNVPGPVCAGDCVPITSGATSGAPLIYTTSDGQTFTASDPCITFPAPGLYYLTQQAFGCGSAIYLDSITVVDSPVASYDNPAFGCPGIPLVFTNTSSELVSFSWDFGDGTAPDTSADPEHIFTVDGTYEVCLTVTSVLPDGCDDVICQTVVISPPPTAGFMVSDSVCLGDETIITTTAMGNLICAYDFMDGNGSNDCNTTHIYGNFGNQVISQTVTDNATGCRDTLLLPTFVRPLPSPAFSLMTMDDCNPDTVDFINETPDANSYLWDFGDNETSVETSPRHTYAEPDTYTVTLTAFTDGICPATTEQVITINEMPNAIAEADNLEICLGEFINFNSISTGPISETNWDFGDGQVAFTAAASHEYLAAGAYTVTMTVLNGDRCSDTTTLEVIVNQPVIAAISAQTDVRCFGEATGSLAVTTSSGLPPFSYDWSNGPSVAENPGIAAGDYTVTITDANLCSTEVSATITESERIDALATVTNVTCAGGADGTVSIAATGGVAPYELQWPGGDANEIITGLSAGNYAVTIVDANGCAVVREVTVPENPPLRLVDSLGQITCFGEHDGIYRLRDVSGGIQPYTVSLVGEDYRASGINISRFDSLGAGFYTFEVIDSVGCFLEKDIEIVEPTEVMVDILEDSIFIELGQSIPLETVFNISDPLFVWSPPNGLDSTDVPSPLARPLVSRTYEVLLTDSRGCSARDEVYVDVDENREVYIPSGFTPNFDGRNDLFRLRTNFPDGIIEVAFFRVFDKWGQLIFEEEGFQITDEVGWDGTKAGEPVEVGAYVYHVKVEYFDGESKLIRGVINVFR